MHHHPVLLPSFVEPDRDVDEILNARSILDLLREHGFQLILHGHKHYPQIFSYDPDPAWETAKTPIPQLIVAGGAAGSKTLPDGKERANTYNVMAIKWNPDALQARVQVVTRGLIRTGPAGNSIQIAGLGKRSACTTGYCRLSKLCLCSDHSLELNFRTPDDELEFARSKQYQELRFNMPVVEVLPLLIAGQGYEALRVDCTSFQASQGTR